MRQILTLLLVVCVCALANAQHSTRMVGESITVDDGLTSNKVYDLLQDNDGYLWIGSAFGLSRYDGYSFENFYALGYDSFKEQANLGNLYLDEKNSLMWIRTAIYTYSCYDLVRQCFVDFSCGNDIHKSFRRFQFVDDGIWMYDDDCIRKVTYHDGRFSCTDYSWENGKLPKEKIIRLVDDVAGCAWVITEPSLYYIDQEGTVKKKLENANISRGCRKDDNSYFLTKENHVLVYGPGGKQKKNLTIPPELAKTGSQNGNFIWQDKWVIFAEKGTLVMDFKSLAFTMPEECQIKNKPILLDEFDGNVTVSNGGTLCIFPPEGSVIRLDLMNNKNFTSGRNRKFTTTQGKDGKYYIASYGNGLFVYDPKTKNLDHYLSSDSNPLIVTNFLLDVMFDQSGCLWISQENAGLAHIHLTDRIEDEYLRPAPQDLNDEANHIFMLSAKNDGTVMTSTRDNKLYRLDVATGQFQLEHTYGSSPFAYMTDRNGHEWVGTPNNGLFVDDVQYTRLDTLHYIPATAIYDFAEDSHGRVWMATWEQGLLLTRYPENENLHYTQFLNRDMNENRINDLELDKNGCLWIATYNGIYAVDTKKKDITQQDFICYNTQNGLLPFNEIHCLTLADDGTLWLGGMGTGVIHLDVSDIDHPAVETIGRQQGLPNHNIYAIIEDQHRNIWIATEGKLARLNRGDSSIDIFEPGSDIQSNLYSQRCALLLTDGRLLLGTGNGITVVNVADIRKENGFVHRPLVTNVFVNGTSIGQEGGWIRHFKDGELNLSHNENTLKISFSCFDYDKLESSMYQYYLEGRESGWNEATTESGVEYGNLPPGHYIFHLRSASGKAADKNETLLRIVIHQPWWNTWWAWLLYIAVASALGYYLYKNWRERFNLHQQVKLEKQLAQFRVDFFTSVAHEFRTPLSIITTAANKMQDGDSSSVSRKTIQTVKRGTNRLSQLVNQLMEFRKVDTGNFRLKVEEGDIVGFVRDIFQDFWNTAQQREQNLSFTPFEKQYACVFDRHIVDTVVYNLLSNAVKYTPEKGAVSMKFGIDRESNRLNIIVEDNGPGISEERQQKMFKPFMEGDVSPGGIGVGLYTSRRMAQTHKGDLSYERLPQGSRFTFTIPADASAYQEADYKRKDIAGDSGWKERHTDEMIKELMPKAMNDHTAVVIEDDPDMLDLIKEELSAYFHTEGFSSGKTGLEGVMRIKPSIVISDVSLGDMKGFDICRKIKDNPETANIPVIMLTGHGGESYQIKGYKAGADDYMVKPCNFNVLVARMAQLIAWSQQTKATSQATADHTTASGQEVGIAAQKPKEGERIITSRSDKLFLEKMQAIMTQHIQDADFTMDDLAQQMNMGRTKFYGKAKELTGMSPNKYLLAERMKLAAELLYDGDLLVSEVCYRVGINDMSYFNKCFKAAYGVTPSKYGK